ncbi:MAG: NUDIX hydrolase [Prevotella sp.]|nr:NUDIX hydrolase [Prevotella sp.]
MKKFSYKYPRPAVTADCMVMTQEAVPRVLLIERGNEPYKGCWALPGGFLDMEETLEECAIRELEEETGLKVSIESIRQVGTYSRVNRDPRGRTISTAFIAVVDSPLPVKGQDDAARAEWFAIDSLPPLAFDHADIIRDGIDIS